MSMYEIPFLTDNVMEDTGCSIEEAMEQVYNTQGHLPVCD